MFIEKLFGNTFGLIWLIVFLVGILALIIWMFVKNDKSVVSEEKQTTRDNVLIIEENIENNKIYEIVESEDGFFRVRKIGSERTLRKFATIDEANAFVSEKEITK